MQKATVLPAELNYSEISHEKETDRRSHRLARDPGHGKKVGNRRADFRNEGMRGVRRLYDAINGTTRY